METWFCMLITQSISVSIWKKLYHNCITTLLSHWWNGPVVKSTANKSQLFRLSISHARKKSWDNHLCNLVWMHLCRRPGHHQNLYQPCFCLLPVDGWAQGEPGTGEGQDSHLCPLLSAVKHTHYLLSVWDSIAASENYVSNYLTLRTIWSYEKICLPHHTSWYLNQFSEFRIDGI